jgi:hypothetical protein
MVGSVEIQLNDTDSAGVFRDEGGATEIVAPCFWRGWFPLEWEYPFQGTHERRRVLRVHSQEPIVIRDLSLQDAQFADLILRETKREIEWARSCAKAEWVRMALGERLFAVEARADVLLAEAERLAQGGSTLNEFWMALGLKMLGTFLEGVRVVSFADEFWRLSDETADLPQFSLLNRFLADPQTLMGFFLKAKGIFASTAKSRLPFFVVHDQDGRRVRTNLEVPREVSNVASLAQSLKLQGGNVSVVPTVLPLFVQLRALSCVYFTDPPYLAPANRLADMLQIPQHPTYAIHFDLAKACGHVLWRALLRDGRGRMSGVNQENRGRMEHQLQGKPTLTFLYVLGGEELLGSLIATAQIRETDAIGSP